MEVEIASLSVWIHKELPSPCIRLAAKCKFTRTVFLLWIFTPALTLGLSQGEDPGPSRAALLEAQHQAAPQTVLPQERSPAARALPRGEEVSRFVANLLRVWKGFHFSTGDFPAGAGFVYGVGYTYSPLGDSPAVEGFPNRMDVDEVAAYSTRRYALLGFDLRLQNFRGTPLNIALHGKASEFPQEEFFGFGRASREEDRTNYLKRSLEGGFDLWIEPLESFRVGGGATYLSPSIGSGRDDRFVSTEDFFDETTLPGFQRQPDFWRFDGFMDFDYRDQPWYPRTGGFYGGRLSSFRDRDLDTFHFRRFEGDLQQYFPLSRREGVIALRANLVMTDFSVGRYTERG